MADSFRDSSDSYALDLALGSQKYTTRVLALLEADLRRVALLALADWAALDLPEPALLSAVGALQRPSWGTWNFLLQSLRNARKSQLRGGQARVREQIESARTLQAILAALDATASSDAVAAARPLAHHLGDKARLKRVSDLIALPIALRNQVAHFPPLDDREWDSIATALVPFVAWFRTDPLGVSSAAGPWPEPWFVRDGEEVCAFNGIEKDLTPMYAAAGSGRPRALPAHGGEVTRALQRLLGRGEHQDTTFLRLLARLAPDEVKGVVLGDFLIGSPVGRGGFATVHIGRQLSTGRKVAVKLLNDGLGEQARIRFQQEAAFLSRITDPTVVGVISHGEDVWSVPRFVDLTEQAWFQELLRGSSIKSYIALEWIDGRTLEAVYQAVHVAKTEPTPELATIRSWFETAARSLAAVHAAGLLHRDIKPANFMVDSEGALHLMDFGIARSDDENRTLITSTGFALGTPPYMSPEQIRAHDADEEVGPASDLYSACATFYELFTGTRVFGHDAETSESVKTRKLAGEQPVSPKMAVKRLPWELETILLGGLQAEVGDRYQSAEQLLRDIEHWKRDEPLEYRRPSRLRRTVLAYRRNRTVANLVLAFTVLAAAGIAVYIFNIQGARSAAEDARVVAESESARANHLREESDRSRGELLLDAVRAQVLAGDFALAARSLDQALDIVAIDRVPPALVQQIAATLPAPRWTAHATTSDDRFGFDAAGALLLGTAKGVALDARTGTPRAGDISQIVDFAARLTGGHGELWPSTAELGELTDGSGTHKLQIADELRSSTGQTGRSSDCSVGLILPTGAYVKNCYVGHWGHRILTVEDGRLKMYLDRNLGDRASVPIASSADGRAILYWKDRLLLLRNPFVGNPELPKSFKDEVAKAGDTPYQFDVDNAIAFDAAPEASVVALSADAVLAASSGHGGIIAIWDTATRSHIGALKLPADVTRLAFSPDHRRLAAADEAGNVAVWDVDRLPASVRVSNGSDEDLLVGVASTSDGPRWIFRRGPDVVIRTSTGAVTLTASGVGKDTRVELSRSGALTVVDSAEIRVRSNDQQRSFEGRYLASLGDGRFRLFDDHVIDLETRARSPIEWPDELAYSHDCVTSQAVALCLGRFKIWDALTWIDSRHLPIEAHDLYTSDASNDIRAVAVDATSMHAYMAGCTKDLRILDLDDGKPEPAEPEGSDDSDANSSDEKTTAVIDLEKAACARSISVAGSIAMVVRDNDLAVLVDLDHHKVLGNIGLGGAKLVALADSGKFVAIAAGRGVMIYDRATLAPVARRALLEDVTSVSFAEKDDETLHVITSSNGYVIRWRDTAAGSELGWRARIKAM